MHFSSLGQRGTTWHLGRPGKTREDLGRANKLEQFECDAPTAPEGFYCRNGHHVMRLSMWDRSRPTNEGLGSINDGVGPKHVSDVVYLRNKTAANAEVDNS